MTTLEVLETARDLIRDEGNWCQGWDTQGDEHCMAGAVQAALGYSSDLCMKSPIPRDYMEAMNTLRATIRPVDREGIRHFNDHHTHAEVLEMFNIAIADELAKQKAEQPKVRMATYTGDLPASPLNDLEGVAA